MQNWAKTLLTIPFGVTFVDVFGYVARVDGESMKPTLNPNVNDTEYVFLNKVIRHLFLLQIFSNGFVYYSSKQKTSR